MKPSIQLTDYLIYVKQGEAIDPWSYVKTVTYGGNTYLPSRYSDGGYVLVQDVGNLNITPKYLTNIEVIDAVNMDTPGVYEVVYKVTVGSAEDEQEGVMRLIVVVTE